MWRGSPTAGLVSLNPFMLKRRRQQSEEAPHANQRGGADSLPGSLTTLRQSPRNSIFRFTLHRARHMDAAQAVHQPAEPYQYLRSDSSRASRWKHLAKPATVCSMLATRRGTDLATRNNSDLASARTTSLITDYGATVLIINDHKLLANVHKIPRTNVGGVRKRELFADYV